MAIWSVTNARRDNARYEQRFEGYNGQINIGFTAEYIELVVETSDENPPYGEGFAGRVKISNYEVDADGFGGNVVKITTGAIQPSRIIELSVDEYDEYEVEEIMDPSNGFTAMDQLCDQLEVQEDYFDGFVTGPFTVYPSNKLFGQEVGTIDESGEFTPSHLTESLNRIVKLAGLLTE